MTLVTDKDEDLSDLFYQSVSLSDQLNSCMKECRELLQDKGFYREKDLCVDVIENVGFVKVEKVVPRRQQEVVPRRQQEAPVTDDDTEKVVPPVTDDDTEGDSSVLEEDGGEQIVTSTAVSTTVSQKQITLTHYNL